MPKNNKERSNHDNNGNLTDKTTGINTTTYTWNYEDKLKTITLPDSSVTTFSYNTDGLRIKKEDNTGTTKYVLDGLAVTNEYDATDTPLVLYTPGVSLRKAGQSYFYHYDGLGSTTEMTDISGNIATTYTYDAFGNLLSSSEATSQPYQYVGQQYYYTEGNLGLQLLGLRWYDAGVGRFVSRDPIGYQGGVNLYGYVGNNAGNGVDPKGSSIKTEGKIEYGPKISDWIKCIMYSKKIANVIEGCAKERADFICKHGALAGEAMFMTKWHAGFPDDAMYNCTRETAGKKWGDWIKSCIKAPY